MKPSNHIKSALLAKVTFMAMTIPVSSQIAIIAPNKKDGSFDHRTKEFKLYSVLRNIRLGMVTPNLGGNPMITGAWRLNAVYGQ